MTAPAVCVKSGGCGVLATGRCSRCGEAFCGSHQGFEGLAKLTNVCSPCAHEPVHRPAPPTPADARERDQRWLREVVRPALLASRTVEWVPLYWHNGWKPKPWRWGQSKKPFQERHDEQGRPAGTGVILGQYEWTGDGKDGSVQRRLTTVLLREDRADGSPIAPMGNFSSTFGAWQLHPGYRYDYSTRSVQLRYGPIPDLLDQRAPR